VNFRPEDMGTLRGVLAPVHPAGWPFVAGAALATVIGFAIWEPLGWLGVLATAFCTYFFRDPSRIVPLGEGLLVAPADGRVCAVDEAVPPPELDMGATPLPRIGIFLNVFDVHINRAPVGGRITRLAYHPGKFLAAADDKASDENERQSFRIETAQGELYGLVQIAGLIARRIVRFVEQGEVVAAGERVGLIRFGSRCDVYLPEGMASAVLVGQRSIAGETVLAERGRSTVPGAGRRG
jgi:phosphatidylserine decarboxylase